MTTKATTGALTILLLLAGAAAAPAATRIVAASGGDFTTIQAALDVAVAGDTILVRAKPTPYFEKVVFPRSGDASAGFISLEAYPGESPVLDGTGVIGSDMVLIEDRSFVRVAGLEIRNNLNVTDGSGVRVLGAGTSIEIRGNDIHDMRGKNAMGITVYGTAATAVSGLVIDGNQIHDCDAAPSESLSLNGNIDGFTVTNNVVRDVNNIGIVFIGGETDIQPDKTKVARNGVCRGNQVLRARSSYGGGYAAGIYVDGARDIVIENNVVTESDIGLEVGAENPGLIASGIVVRSNVLHRNDKAGLAFGGYKASVGRTQGCEFRNNTIFENDTLDTGFGQLWIQYASGNVVRNNVLVATASNVLVSSDVGNVGNTLDHNVWYAPGGATGALFTWNGAAYTGFAAYRAGTAQDAASLFADPLLVAPGAGDFHLEPASPAINAGDPATVVAAGETDLDGAPRLSGPRVDAGADEVTCGDGVQNPGEECDDGNLVDGDGCDSNCTLTGCGNRIVTAGEECDDGNHAAGDCCSPTCQFEAAGSACDDGDPCTNGDGCSAGVCAGAAQPAANCHAAARTSLLIRDQAADARDQLTWRWTHGDAVALAELGDPVGGATSYALCVYATTGGVAHVARPALAIPAGGLCKGKPCWKALGASTVKYADRDRTPDGVDGLTMKAGAAGASSIVLTAKGPHFVPPSLPLGQDPAVTVQLRGSNGACFGSAYTTPAQQNDAGQFRDQTP